jgi:hypothetical protein
MCLHLKNLFSSKLICEEQKSLLNQFIFGFYTIDLTSFALNFDIDNINVIDDVMVVLHMGHPLFDKGR